MIEKILIIEGSDFVSFPKGGQLSYISQVIAVFGDKLALVGIATADEPVGIWYKKKLHGNYVWFFAVGKRSISINKPLIPRRITFLLELMRYKNDIVSKGCCSAYLHSPEALLAVRNWGIKHVCYHFHGTENPLSNSRYRWAKVLKRIYNRVLYTVLEETVEKILVSASRQEIEKLRKSAGSYLQKIPIEFAPTRVDTSIFHSSSVDQHRRPEEAGNPIRFVTCGRISRIKGWDLIIDALVILVRRKRNVHLTFIGDGEDRKEVEKSIKDNQMEKYITITGYKEPRDVAGLLNKSSVYLVGSKKEGWSVSMLEALACGLPMVSTQVSGASAMIVEGISGYIVGDSNRNEYANSMMKAAKLQKPNEISIGIAKQYSLDKLGLDLPVLWCRF